MSRSLFVAICACLLTACPSNTPDCRDFGRVPGAGGSCVCPEPFVSAPDMRGCECPPGLVESGDTCVAPDAGPGDAFVPDDSCVPVTLYRDADGDGRGDPDSETTACPGLAGHVDSADDCDDTCDVCWEGATETCDESNNDCDGYVDEGVREFVGEPTAITSGRSIRTQFTSSGFDIAQLDDTRYAVLYDASDGSGLALSIFDTSTESIVAGPLEVGSGNLSYFQRLVVSGDRLLVFWTGVRKLFGRSFGWAPLEARGDVTELAHDDTATGLFLGSTSAASLGGGAAVSWVGRDNVARVRLVPANLVALVSPTQEVADEATAVAIVNIDGAALLTAVRSRGDTAELVTRRLSTEGVLEEPVSTPAPGAEALTLGTNGVGGALVAWISRSDVDNTDSPHTTTLGVVDPSGVVVTQETISPPRQSSVPRFSVVNREVFVGNWHVTATGYPATLVRWGDAREDVAPLALPASPAVTRDGHVLFVEGDLAVGIEGDLAFRRLGCPAP